MTNKLKLREKLAYGMGDLANNIVFSAISFYLLYFFVKVGGVKPTSASLIFLLSKLWDAITDYMMGVIVDKTHTKWGQRIVYILFGTIPYAISFVLLWVVPSSNSQVIRVIYYTIVYMFYETAWTVVYIPYNALSANITDDYDERTSLTGIRIILANVGMILGAAVFALLADGQESILYNVVGSEKLAYLISSVIFAVIAAVCFYVCAFNVKERVSSAKENTQGFFKTLGQFFRLPEFNYIMFTYLLSMMGFDILMAIFMFFIDDSLGFKGGSMSMVFVAIPLVVAILSATFWVKLSEKLSKHKAYMISCILMTVIMLNCIWVKAGSIWQTVLLTAGAGIGLSAIQIIPFAALPDVVEVDEYTYGERREGAYYGVTQFMYKLASGIGVAFVSLVLGIFGYKETVGNEVVVQPERALMAIRVILGVVPGALFMISVWTSYKANLNRDRFDMIRDELNKRHNANQNENN